PFSRSLQAVAVQHLVAQQLEVDKVLVQLAVQVLLSQYHLQSLYRLDSDLRSQSNCCLENQRWSLDVASLYCQHRPASPLPDLLGYGSKLLAESGKHSVLHPVRFAQWQTYLAKAGDFCSGILHVKSQYLFPGSRWHRRMQDGLQPGRYCHLQALT